MKNVSLIPMTDLSISGSPDNSVTLHVFRGQVWEAVGTGLPMNTKMDVVSFCSSWQSSRLTQLLGVDGNSELIYLLSGKRPLWLASPLCCPTSIDRMDPVRAVYHLRRTRCSPSLGGLHLMAPHERVPYAIASGHALPELLAATHPAWPHWLFVRGLNQTAATKLLGDIRDPRWYVDLERPNTAGRLFHWLGLTPGRQNGSASERPTGHQARSDTVFAAWWDEAKAERLRAGESPQPGDFVWKAWLQHLAKHQVTAMAFARARLRASQALVNFLRLTWLAEIYKTTGTLPDGGQPLFRAADFFRDLVDKEEYDRYILGRCTPDAAG